MYAHVCWLSFIPCTDVVWYLILEVLTYSHVLKVENKPIHSTCCKLHRKNQLLFVPSNVLLHGTFERFAVNAHEIVFVRKFLGYLNLPKNE